ncbi:flagellar export chaperone FliS [Limnoglobus roseus]|uniref:Flagellar protein FliS n=1 Tax=Limnoglobus roseus TaxID=2598579 RepID=A0A5C1A3Z1_9BACT|nr:flagellar export chaperone FliS [Limnoglobus roseus]QEL13789.1 flagellar protein FliS [Limnoglobus roseus]
MNVYQKYNQSEPLTGMTRIEVLLATFDGALTRLDKAAKALTNGDVPVATPYLVKAQLLVSALAAGVRLDIDEANGTNMLRLYEFVVHEIKTPRLKNVENAVKILTILREGFEAIKVEAIRLERSGELVGANRLQMVLETA